MTVNELCVSDLLRREGIFDWLGDEALSSDANFPVSHNETPGKYSTTKKVIEGVFFIVTLFGAYKLTRSEPKEDKQIVAPHGTNLTEYSLNKD